MTGDPDVRWVDRTAPAMHEVAEVLGTTTDLVMAVTVPPRSKLVCVFYTPGYPGDETVWAAVLERGPDNILVERSREPQPGMWERMKAELDRTLRKGDDR
jgi:hypothetical protein